MMWILYVVTLVVCASALPKNVEVTSHNAYFTIQDIKSEGYHAEVHNTVTKDGYILEMHRIPHKRYENKSEDVRPVVLLMHGILGASNSFIINGHEHSIGYNLADAGYDVWMGNARGTKNSRRHLTLDPDSPTERVQFFNFSFEEIGLYDTTAMVDYILKYTGRQKLHYIGHSQGGTVFLVLNSMRPEYNKKFVSAHLLAGVGYQNHFPNSQLLKVARFTDVIYSLATSRGYVELYPPNSTFGTTTDNQNISPDFCTSNAYFQNICKSLSSLLQLTNSDIDADLIGGAAVKQLAHYGQNIRDKAFRRWDYNTTQNLQLYGSKTPPQYDLRAVTVNTTLHYTLNDLLLSEKDVLAMANDIPNAGVRQVERENFLHEEFVTAKDVKELVTNHIIKAIAMAQQIEDSGGSDKDETETEIEIEDDSPNSGPGFDLGIIFKTYIMVLNVVVYSLQ